MMMASTTDTNSNNEYDDLLRDIFNMNDVNKEGFITIQSFLTIIKENWPSSLDESNLENLVNLIDPYSVGRINYEQFINGITQMTQLQTTATTTTSTESNGDSSSKKKNKYNNYDPDRHSNGSTMSNDTFNEYDAFTDSELYNNHHNHDNRYESSGIKSGNNKTTQKLNQYLDSNVVDESYEDYGTLDTQNTNTIDALSSTSSLHSSLFVDLSDTNSNINTHSSLLTSPLKSSIKSSKKRANELYRNSSHQFNNNSNDYDQNLSGYSNAESGISSGSSTSSSRHDERIINELEDKVRNLENKIDELKADKHDYTDRYTKLQQENSVLNEKLHELEELNHDYEKSFKLTIETEKARYNDYIMKLNTKNSEEKDTLLAQLNRSETEINNYKEDISKHIRQINELNRKVDLKSLNEYQLDEKLTNLKEDFKRITKEKDLYKEDLETMKTQHHQRVEALTKELTDLRNLQQNSKRRAQTIFQTDETRVRELELELQQARSECKHLHLTIEELEARILRNSLDAGKILMSQANVPSLAAEMETLSKDELMDKLKNEQLSCQRYREYVERILAAIMERNPEILEIRQMTSGTTKISNNKSSVSFSKY